MNDKPHALIFLFDTDYDLNLQPRGMLVFILVATCQFVKQSGVRHNDSLLSETSEVWLTLPFHYLDLFLRQPIQLIHQRINLSL